MTPLLAWRKRLKLSQKAAAEALGCGRRALQQWETGAHKTPRYILLAAAAVMYELAPIDTGRDSSPR